MRSGFGLFEGRMVELFTLTNSRGNSIAVTNYGATWASAIVPDRDGKKGDVLLGYGSMQGYASDACYLGASIGRFANRIAAGRFAVDGVQYQTTVNNGDNTLHGGVDGLSFRLWDSREEADGVTFSTVSPDGDQGFPGRLSVSVRYRWGNDDRVTIEFRATTDKATPVSLTNHAYFNLAGEGSVLDHQLKIHADSFLPMLDGGVVYGEIRPVEGTPFDFRTAKAIGQDIEADDDQIRICKGYDESFLVKNVDDGEMRLVAEACDPASGRALAMSSTYPTVHLYTANYFGGTLPGKGGKIYGEREAFCLEAQYSPNSPNLPDFPSCILRPGQEYKHTIEVAFTVKE
jgi:aldose 1-epimerase